MTSDLPALPQDDALLTQVSKPSSVFLIRAQLLQSMSDPVKLKKPKTRKGTNPEAGQFLLGFGDTAKIMDTHSPNADGTEFRAVMGPFRPHAWYMVNKEIQEETFTVDDVYKKIEKKEKELKLVKKEGHAAKAGVDVLIYLPDYSCFATFMFAGSYRDRAAPVGQMRGKLVVFTSEFIPSKKYGGWYKPKLELCTLKDGDLSPSMPADQHQEAMEAFAAGQGGEPEPEENEPSNLGGRPR